MSFLVKLKRLLYSNQVALVNAICFIVFCVIILDYTFDPIWKSFGDPLDYIKQSKFSLLSSYFYMPPAGIGFSPRPFTSPLFYKFVNGDPLSIIWEQKIVHCICALSFVTSILVIIKNKIVSLIAIPVLYYFFTWWPIVGFTENILSESLSMSFLFLWLSMIIFCIYFKNRTTLTALLIVSFLFSFTRDTWPYIILIANVLILLFFYKKDQRLKKYFIIISLFSGFVFFFQSYTSKVGERYKIPLYNVMASRISKNPEYLNWFKERGMPLTDTLVKYFDNVNVEELDGILRIYRSYDNPIYKPLHQWLVEHGKNEYMLFMLTHPSYLFLEDQTEVQKNRIFEIFNFGYIVEPKGFFDDSLLNTYSFPPMFLLIIMLLLCFAFIFYKRKNPFLLLPLLLVLLTIANVYLSYNADTLEVQRHLFITEILCQLTALISVFLMCDLLILEIILPRFNKFNNRETITLK